MKILFVCMGNICRSPTAEGVMARMLAEAGLADRVTIDSAGTGGWHEGELPDPRTRAAARKRGLDLTHRAPAKTLLEQITRRQHTCSRQGVFSVCFVLRAGQHIVFIANFATGALAHG